MTIAPAILSFGVASFISVSELITRSYPRTYFLLRRCGSLYLYAAVYGAAAFAATLLLDSLVASKAIKMEGFGLASPWVRAFYLGMTIKAILNINFFNVTVGTQSMPVGPSTLVQLYEPIILRNITFREFTEVRRYVTPAANRHPNVAAVKQQIKDNVPATLPANERGAFENDIDKAQSVTVAMEGSLLRAKGRCTRPRASSWNRGGRVG